MGKRTEPSHPLEQMRVLPRRRFLGFAAFTGLTVIGRDAFIGVNVAHAHSDDVATEKFDPGLDGLGGFEDDELREVASGDLRVVMDCEGTDLMELSEKNLQARAAQVLERVLPPYTLEATSKGDTK
jgi:hypothetical protein